MNAMLCSVARLCSAVFSLQCCVVFSVQCLVCSVMQCAVRILSVGQMVQESHMAGDTGSTREGECIFALEIICTMLHSAHCNVTTMSVQCDNHHSTTILQLQYS